jgi:hypothetical protein
MEMSVMETYAILWLVFTFGSMHMYAKEPTPPVRSDALVQTIPIPKITKLIVNEKTQHVIALQQGHQTLLQASFDKAKNIFRLKTISLRQNKSNRTKANFGSQKWGKKSEILAVNNEHTLAIGYKYENGACFFYSYRIDQNKLDWIELFNPIFADSETEQKLKPNAVEFTKDSTFLIASTHNQKSKVWKIDKETGKKEHHFSLTQPTTERSTNKVILGGITQKITPNEFEKLYSWNRMNNQLEVMVSTRKQPSRPESRDDLGMTSIAGYTHDFKKFTIGKSDTFISAFAMQKSPTDANRHDYMIGNSNGQAWLYSNQLPMHLDREPISLLPSSNQTVTAVSFAPDMHTMALGTRNHSLYILQKSEPSIGMAKVTRTVWNLNQPIIAIAFTQTHLLAATTDFLHVFIWKK